MTQDKDTFHKYKALKEPLTITIRDGKTLAAEGVGSIYLEFTKEHGG